MGNHNSHIQFALNVLINMLQDMYEQAPPELLTPTWRKELCRDIETVKSRITFEGLSFLTKQLPKLDAWILALCSGVNLPNLPFKMNRKTGFPRFLGGLTGNLRSHEASSDEYFYYVIKSFRQVGHLFYKANVPFSPADLKAAEEKYLGLEEEVTTWEFPTDSESVELLSRARAIVHSILGEYSHTRFDTHIPKHGPGATADRKRGNQKYNSGVYCPRLAFAFPPLRFSRTQGSISDSTRASCDDFSVPTSRVVFVPKDSRGPRTISAEPAAFQWHQQYLLSCLEEIIPLATNGRVQFKDQSKNAELARLSSVDGRFATLDMSDASDRIPWRLVEYLVPPSWWYVMRACRSQATLLPSGKTIRLAKFAPMGSAICFPIEAMIFYALACAVDPYDQQKLRASVHVFGDDIVCPTMYAPRIMRLIEQATPLRFNRRKSFVAGFFRESCGTDAYRGEVVTPLRYKGDISATSKTLFQDAVPFGNQAHQFGYWRTSAFIAEYFKAPVVKLGSVGGALVHESFVETRPNGLKYDFPTQSWRLKCHYLKSRQTSSPFYHFNDRLIQQLIRRFSDRELLFADAEVVTPPRTARVVRGWRPIRRSIYKV